MQRGIIILTHQELDHLINSIDINRFQDKSLISKLIDLLRTNQDSYNILLSSEDMEFILDEIGLIQDPILSNISLKISERLSSFRD